MAIPVENDPQLVARLQTERWPLAPNVRSRVVEMAFELCGLEVQDDGQVRPLPRAEDAPPIKPRIKLSALRLIKSFDKLALKQKRLEQALEARRIEARPYEAPGAGSPPLNAEIFHRALTLLDDGAFSGERDYTNAELESRVLTLFKDWELSDGAKPKFDDEPRAAEALAADAGTGEPSRRPWWQPPVYQEPLPPDWRVPPPPATDPLDEDLRWPITRPMREAVIAMTLDLCGLRVTPEGEVVPSGTTPPKPRIKLAAMRLLAGFDALSLEETQMKNGCLSERELSPEEQMDPEVARRMSLYIHDEELKLREWMLAEAAEAEAAAAAQAQAPTAAP